MKGYVCTEEAAAVFKQKCPDLGIEQLKTAEYDADRLWTARSITLTRLAIVGLWLATFVALTALVGSFLVFQLKVPGVRAKAAKAKTIGP